MRTVYPINGFVQRPAAVLVFMLWSMSMTRCVPDGSDHNSTANTQLQDDPTQAAPPEPGCEWVNGTVSIRINKVSVQLKAPAGQPIGDLLLLPGWDDPADVWCVRSRACAKALKRGYRLIIPDMGKSMYCLAAYPETREDWRTAPDFPWLRDTLIPTLQEKYCLLRPGANNYVIGAGAGARGALRLTQALPDLFVAAACLSGDYNPSLAPRDNLYRGFFGDIEEHGDRWRVDENLCAHVSTITTPLLLSHGQLDDFIPAAQTEYLYNILREENPSLNVQLSLSPDKGYGFAFWNGELQDVFHFFETTQAARPETP